MRTPRTRRHALRGFGMLEALIAMVVLVFGLLGMSRFQAKVVKAGTDGQVRLPALRMADQLASLVRIDQPANAACYTAPAAGVCGNAAARTLTDNWRAATLAALPGAARAPSPLNAAHGRLTIRLGWAGKLPQDAGQDASTPPYVHALTDIRF